MSEADNEAADERPALTKELHVINIGLSSFAEEMTTLGVEVVQVDWRPPAGGDAELAELLAEMGA